MGLAGPESAYNIATSAFDFSPEANTDIYNQIMDRVLEKHGEDVAHNFNGAAFNCLYVLLNIMRKAGATDAVSVMNTWRTMDSIETIYGTGFPGGKISYGWKDNQAMGMQASMFCLPKNGPPVYQRDLFLVP